MKDRYFGNINDFRKYGILRSFAGAGISIGIDWMMLDDEIRPDASKFKYLEHPEMFRKYDPELFDELLVAHQKSIRSVDYVKSRSLIPNARYFKELVMSGTIKREEQFSRMLESFKGSELLYLDPIEGVDLNGDWAHRAYAAGFVLWFEIQKAWNSGLSMLIYNHSTRAGVRDYPGFLKQVFVERLGVQPVILITANVTFVLLVQPAHDDVITEGLSILANQWHTQIEIAI